MEKGVYETVRHRTKALPRNYRLLLSRDLPSQGSPISCIPYKASSACQFVPFEVPESFLIQLRRKRELSERGESRGNQGKPTTTLLRTLGAPAFSPSLRKVK